MSVPRRVSLPGLAVVTAVGLAGPGCARPVTGTTESRQEVLSLLEQDRARIDETLETMMKRVEAYNAARPPEQAGVRLSEIFGQDLTSDQREGLEALLRENTDLSYRALLRQVLADREAIRALEERVTGFEASPPDRLVVAKSGDRHDLLAIQFLTGEAGLDLQDAEAILKKADTAGRLEAGDQVWLYFDPATQIFRTWVADKGTGPRPAPKSAAIAEHGSLPGAPPVPPVIAPPAASGLERYTTQLEEAFADHQNSLFYHAESSRALRNKGIVSGFLRRLRDDRTIRYDKSVNLSQKTTISLEPRSYGLDRIRTVRLLPSHYREGRDYRVELGRGRGAAHLVILAPEAFKGKEILIALGG